MKGRKRVVFFGWLFFNLLEKQWIISFYINEKSDFIFLPDHWETSSKKAPYPLIVIVVFLYCWVSNGQF